VPDAASREFRNALPTGPHSDPTPFVPGGELQNACNTKLVMPTDITGQSGVVIKQSTNISLTGCAAAKPTDQASQEDDRAHEADRRHAGGRRGGHRCGCSDPAARTGAQRPHERNKGRGAVL
jgi:hypothetical protein